MRGPVEKNMRKVEGGERKSVRSHLLKGGRPQAPGVIIKQNHRVKSRGEPKGIAVTGEEGQSNHRQEQRGDGKFKKSNVSHPSKDSARGISALPRRKGKICKRDLRWHGNQKKKVRKGKEEGGWKLKQKK